MKSSFVDDYCYTMKKHSTWISFDRGALLPTPITHRPSQDSANMWYISANLVQRLWCPPRWHQKNRDELFSTTKNPYGDRTNPFAGPKKMKTSKLFFLAIPSYLNKNCRVKMDADNARRSSLLDGISETLQSVKNCHQLTLPQSENILKTPTGNGMQHAPGESIPLVSVTKKFHNPGRLDGYLLTTRLFKDDEKKTRSSLLAVLLVFLAAVLLLAFVYMGFPELNKEEKDVLFRLPGKMDDAKAIGRVLSRYKNDYYYELMSAMFITYIFLQTFAIPGSIFLSILLGFLYPFAVALLLVCTCSALGATGCYFISYLIGKPLVNKYLRERKDKWQKTVDGHRGNLFWYILFLRVTPFLPNWFINIVSPVIEIPASIFFTATFVGVAPLSTIAIQGGKTLYQLSEAKELMFSTETLIFMFAVAVLSLLPIYLKKRFGDPNEQEKNK